MPAPLYGADDPRNCSGSSKSEVLENIKNNLDAFLALPPETKSKTEVPTRYTTRRKTGKRPNKRNSNPTIPQSNLHQIH